MEFLQGYFVTALWALVFSCILAKLFSSAVSSDDNKKKAENDVVAKGLSVEGTKGENFESSESLKMVEEDEDQVFVERSETAEQCGDVRDGGCEGEESKNIGFLEVGASKVDVFRGFVGKDDAAEEVDMVGTEIGLRQEDEKEMKMSDKDVSDDDWEGIERSELEVLFAKAINFVECGKDDALSNLGSELQMQLYGLHKIAMEGPCFEPQPMAFKVSARAKWNAWQRMGSMSSEVAMEHYIRLLSDVLPAWIRCSSTESCVNSSSAFGNTGDPVCDTTSIQSDCANEK